MPCRKRLGRKLKTISVFIPDLSIENDDGTNWIGLRILLHPLPRLADKNCLFTACENFLRREKLLHLHVLSSFRSDLVDVFSSWTFELVQSLARYSQLRTVNPCVRYRRAISNESLLRFLQRAGL